MAVTARVSLSTISTDTVNRTALCQVTIVCTSTYGSYNNGGVSGYIEFSGSQIDYNGVSSIKRLNFSGKTILANASVSLYGARVTVHYDSSGNASFTAFASVNTGISSGTITATNSLTLANIGASSGGGSSSLTKSTISTISGDTIGDTIRITLSRAANTKCDIQWEWGTSSGSIATKSSASSFSWTTSVAGYAGYLTTNYYGTCTITCNTYTSDGGQYIGTHSKTFTLYLPTSVKPSINSVDVIDNAGYFDDLGYYVTGKSSIEVNVDAESVYGATIKRYSITLGQYSKTTANANFGVLNLSGSYKLLVTVTDTRGRTASTLKTLSFSSNDAPDISATWARRWDTTTNTESNEGTAVKIHSQGYVKNDGATSATVKIEGRLGTSESWTTINSRSVSSSWSYDQMWTGISADNRYVVRVTATDNVGTSVSREFAIETPAPILDFKYNGEGVAVGMYSEIDGFEIGMPTHFYDTMEIDGQTEINNALSVTGGTVLSSTLDVTGNAELNGTLSVAKAATFANNVTAEGISRFNGNIRMDYGTVLQMANSSGSFSNALTMQSTGRPLFQNHVALQNGMNLQWTTTGGSYKNILCMNSSTLELYWPDGGLRGMVWDQLWAGSLSTGGSRTVSGSSSYNVFAITFDSAAGTSSTSPDRFVMIGTRNSARTFISAIGGIDDGAHSRVVLATIATSGNSWTLRACSEHQLSEAVSVTRHTITEVYGIL